MATYAIYSVNATVERIKLHLRGVAAGAVVVEVPEFYVEADSKSEAYAKAAEIVDPLQMTGLRTIEVKKEKKKWKKRHGSK